MNTAQLIEWNEKNDRLHVVKKSRGWIVVFDDDPRDFEFANTKELYEWLLYNKGGIEEA